MNHYSKIEETVLSIWPTHAAALSRAQPDSDSKKKLREEISKLILELTGDNLAKYVHGYHWMCRMVLEEEMVFRRTGRYRLASFAETDQLVYADPELMSKYMDGLLLSQVLWANHIEMLDYYINDFLGTGAGVGSHLEVGPGHGLLLYLAARVIKGRVTAWDISATSIEQTRAALSVLGAPASIRLDKQNLFDCPDDGETFDSVVISEVLEHLEQPQLALHALRKRMESGGRIFVNAPVNSPAIDHIYLYRSPEELVEMVKECGFEVESVRIAPASGYTEARARKSDVSISCGVIARCP
ncbi:MAG: class I SAM-dependent methyltransferase [Gammaproteobacteria bacterium]|nr:class I SAM-dependent methyltransferase [Gammaproteobacteria bacterium]MBU1624001.1 class I SAM-dependent methyltransferase [Gammaproteobacteria bacterium]MBU1981729.1 class I SAM-dependent methyltransferase [Gammaproteobacteria bacterium]